MRCGWCQTHNESGTNCVNCGGPLPAPAGPDAGPAPPSAPRSLPPVFVRRLLYTHNFGVMFGAIFGGVGLLVSAIFLAVAIVFPPMLLGVCIASIFPIIGGSIGFIAWKRAQQRVETLVRGRAALGSVSSVEKNTSVRLNGKHPWQVEYLFEVDGQRRSGTVSSFDAAITRLQVGHPVHVLYMPADPDQSALWPPIA